MHVQQDDDIGQKIVEDTNRTVGRCANSKTSGKRCSRNSQNNFIASTDIFKVTECLRYNIV